MENHHAVRYVTVSELIYINGTIVGSAAIASGRRQVRDIALLDAAAARPAASAFGADAYPTLAEKAAVLLHGVARNHPFADGNKRTATVGALFMLYINGVDATWDQHEALTMILSAAEGRCGMTELAAWLPIIPRAGAFPLLPDADADMAHIAAIIGAQKWLLDALETR